MKKTFILIGLCSIAFFSSQSLAQSDSIILADLNGNGIPDIFEGPGTMFDTTVIGGFDLDLSDSDGNGIPDIFEGPGGGNIDTTIIFPGGGIDTSFGGNMGPGFTDVNGNGIPDIFEGPGGGIIIDTLLGGNTGAGLADANGNGIPDIFEGPGVIITNPNGNGNGNGGGFDFDLTDANGNGIPDILEGFGGVIIVDTLGGGNTGGGLDTSVIICPGGGIDTTIIDTTLFPDLTDANGNGIPDIFEGPGGGLDTNIIVFPGGGIDTTIIDTSVIVCPGGGIDTTVIINPGGGFDTTIIDTTLFPDLTDANGNGIPDIFENQSGGGNNLPLFDEFVCYPTMVNDYTTLECTVQSDIVANIDIYDLRNGLLVQTLTLELYQGVNEQRIDLSTLEKGYYAVRLHSNGMGMQSTKIMK